MRAYDPAAIRSVVSDALPESVGRVAHAVPGEGDIAQWRGALGAADPAREASLRSQTRILIGSAVVLGALMAGFTLFGNFDASADVSAAVGILLTGLAQFGLLVWAVVLVVRWRIARIGRSGPSGPRPGRAIWITLALSPLPLLFLRGMFEAF